jgi:hypothetical protein
MALFERLGRLRGATHFADVISAKNLAANPLCTRGSATMATKPANMMQAIGFARRQERRSRASTANEHNSRQRAAFGAVESDKEPAAATERGCLTISDDIGKDKAVLLIIALLKLHLSCQCFHTLSMGTPSELTSRLRCFVSRIMRHVEEAIQPARTRPSFDNKAQGTCHFAHLSQRAQATGDGETTPKI